MRPNSRETTACAVCDAPIFFALTRAGEWQPLDVDPHPSGKVMAYRGVRQWLARTVPSERPAQAGEQLELDAVAELVDDPREHSPHPLEKRYRVHAGVACAGAPPVQGNLFGDGPVDLRGSVATAPAPRRRARTASPSPLIYNVKPGASDNPGTEQQGDAKVFDWDKHAPRIAARRRAARSSAAGQ